VRQYLSSDHSPKRGWLARRGSPVVILLLILAPFALSGTAAAQQAKLLVTVFDDKTGEPVKDLTASNFNILDDKTQLVVERAEYKESLLDLMLLVDSSLLGEMVRPLGSAFVKSLSPDEQMAIVAFDSSAKLIQDFTSSKELLLKSLQQVDYGNNPRVLDALYAAIDSGFDHAVGRRVIVLLSAGVEGRSRVSESEVLQLARQKNVAIYPVYVVGAERGMFRRLAEYSGGAYFGARRLKLQPQPLSDLVYSVIRGYYELSVSGVHTLGHEIRVKIEGLPKSDKKIWASARPVE
jgi:VWFA-related protein